MPDHVYVVSEIVGSSSENVDHAIRNAVERASASVKHLDWFEVTQIRGHIDDGEIKHIQVTVKVGSRLPDA